MSEHILDELSWRGLIAQSTDADALRRELDQGPVTLYCGFDPTAPSLHAGNLVPLLMLKLPESIRHLVLHGDRIERIKDILARINPALIFVDGARFAISEQHGHGVSVSRGPDSKSIGVKFHQFLDS